MFKSFASKTIVPIALSVAGFVIVCSLVFYSSIKVDLLRCAVEEEVRLADLVVSSTRDTMMKSDREALAYIIDSIGAHKEVEHLRIFNKEGVITFSSDPGELNQVVNKTAAGCIECHSGPKPKSHLVSSQRVRRFINAKHHSVIAITTPIYNGASCSSAACHFHPSHKKVLGILDIGLSTDPLDSTLLALRWKTVVFCIMVIILCVGGVSALLKRNLLTPINQLIAYAEKVSGGKLDNDFPRGVSEAETLGRIYLDMAREKYLAESIAQRSKSKRAKDKEAGGKTLPQRE